MAGVTLDSITDKNMNFYGRLPRDVELQFRIYEPKLIKKSFIDKLMPFDGINISISSFIGLLPDFCCPEWRLNTDGQLVNWSLGKDWEVVSVWGFDLIPWIKTLTSSDLRIIECFAFNKWRREKDKRFPEDVAKLTTDPEFYINARTVDEAMCIAFNQAVNKTP